MRVVSPRRRAEVLAVSAGLPRMVELEVEGCSGMSFKAPQCVRMSVCDRGGRGRPGNGCVVNDWSQRSEGDDGGSGRIRLTRTIRSVYQGFFLSLPV